MDQGGISGCYYRVLGIQNSATAAEIRGAYRKLAMKWHPDRWMRDPSLAGEAKRRFQQIQEAYEVLSDEGKRAMYDSGLYNPFEEEEEGFSDFMNEMLSMMDSVRNEQKNSFEELQELFAEMVGEPSVKFGGNLFHGFDGGASTFEVYEPSRKRGHGTSFTGGGDGGGGGGKSSSSRSSIFRGSFGSFMPFVI